MKAHATTATPNMATDTALPSVLSSFTTATDLALGGLPNATALLPPENGITLLDAKNEIFLAYLQALALRNLNVIRSIKDGADAENMHKLSNELTLKLVEQRVYLERGVKPLEQKIKYQVDKVVKAAEDAERVATQKARPTATKVVAEEEGSDEEEDEDEDDEGAGADIDSLAFRPNASAMSLPARSADSTRRTKSKEDGIYRPPRISATAMPMTETREKKERRPGRSATLDEYVNNELSTAPMAQPSIGSTITEGGRRLKDARQLAKEQERREYEETNLVRLPKEGKKDRAKSGGRDRGGGFGGEEWRGLGDSLDRIGDLTKRKGGRDTVLEKSRKRRAVEDSPRDTGVGAAFDVKKKRMLKKMR